MKFFIKNLKGSQFSIELDSKSTIQELKNEIEKTQGFDATQMKLLLTGKMLDNSKTLEECKIKDGNIIIMMNAKPKGNAQSASMTQPKKEAKKVEISEKKEEPKRIEIPEKREEPKRIEIPEKKEEPKKIEIPEKKEEPKKIEEPDKEIPKKIKEPEKKEEQQKQANLQSNISNSEYSSQINTLVDMGYELEDVEKAINAAKGNTNLAIEYLNSDDDYLNSDNSEPIPQMQIQDNNQNQNNQNQNQKQQIHNRNLPLELKRNASFIKCICKDDPKIVFGLLSYIEQKNPVLMEKIKEYEIEFKNFLVSPISQEDIDNFNLIKDSYKELFYESERPKQYELNLTEADAEAIKRLTELGKFNQNEVIQAYIYCNKNEERAANYLFEMNMVNK